MSEASLLFGSRSSVAAIFLTFVRPRTFRHGKSPGERDSPGASHRVGSSQREYAAAYAKCAAHHSFPAKQERNSGQRPTNAQRVPDIVVVEAGGTCVPLLLDMFGRTNIMNTKEASKATMPAT